jgi:iron(III) transport system ATP-binding protein
VIDSGQAAVAPAMRTDRVVRRFGGRAAVDEVSLTVERHELVAVLGPSGSGKSTLLRLLAGFEVPDAGTVEVAGAVVAGDGRWVEPERRRIGFVPQGDSLFPHLSVADNVAFGVRRDGRRVAEVLDLVGLLDRAQSDPSELSGGERQRVALARALAPRPELILLDEPFSALDAALRVKLRTEVAALLREAKSTAVWVTHDQEEALSLADRLVLMRDGVAVQTGTPVELYWHPVDLWSARFLGDLNVVAARPGDGGVDTPLGPFGLRSGGRVAGEQVGVRPESLVLSVDDEGAGVVRGREFRGRDVLYHVELGELGDVRVQMASFDVVEVGERVSLAPAPGARALPL